MIDINFLNITPDEIDPHVIDNVATMVKPYVRAFAHTTYGSVRVVDLYRQELIYVADNPLSLSGFEARDVSEMGLGFLERYVDEEDLDFVLQAGRDALQLIMQHPREQRCDFVMSSDMRLRYEPTGKWYHVLHKVTPLMLTPNGKVWLVLCIDSFPTKHHHDRALLRRGDAWWSYSHTDREWESLPPLDIDKRQMMILYFAAQGHSIKQISDTLGVSQDTIKKSRSQLFKQLDVTNMAEALNVLQNFCL